MIFRKIFENFRKDIWAILRDICGWALIGDKFGVGVSTASEKVNIAGTTENLFRLVPVPSRRSNAKTYATSSCQGLENLYQFKAFMEQSP